jgi:hypothetical protein
MCDACENILTIFKHRLPRVLNDIIHEFSQTGRYCVQHQQCSICKNLVTFDAADLFYNTFPQKDPKTLLCRKHRSYIDPRPRYVNAKHKCWHHNCSRESTMYLISMKYLSRSCNEHESAWYRQEHIIESYQRYNHFDKQMIPID